MKTICYGIFVMICEPMGTQVQVDSFCQLYSQVVVVKGDAAIAAPLGVKQRILANEQKYRKLCASAKGN